MRCAARGPGPRPPRGSDAPLGRMRNGGGERRDGPRRHAKRQPRRRSMGRCADARTNFCGKVGPWKLVQNWSRRRHTAALSTARKAGSYKTDRKNLDSYGLSVAGGVALTMSGCGSPQCCWCWVSASRDTVDRGREKRGMSVGSERSTA